MKVPSSNAKVQHLEAQLTNARSEAAASSTWFSKEKLGLKTQVDQLRELLQTAEHEKNREIAATQKKISSVRENAESNEREKIAELKNLKDKELEAMKSKYNEVLNKIREQAKSDQQSLQEAVATLTRQFNAAEKAKVKAEEHAKSLDSKVAEAEQAAEKLRAAKRSMTAMEGQIKDFQDVVLRQRAVIGDLHREAQVSAAAQNIVSDSLKIAKAAATGANSPAPRVKLPQGQTLSGVDLRLQQELILQYEALLRQQEAASLERQRQIEEKHASTIEALGRTHQMQMVKLRDICKAQLMNFSTKHEVLQQHLSQTHRAPPSKNASKKLLLRQHRLQKLTSNVNNPASISLDTLRSFADSRSTSV